MKKWLFILLSSMLVLVISQLFLVAKSFQLHFSDYTFALNLIRVISVLSLIGLLISPFFFPSILYGLPRAPENEEKIKKIQRKNNVQTSEKKQTSGTYESDYLKLIGQKVSSFMENHQLYLESDCNLAYFSKRINIPPHHLAYYFREVKKQRFNDFRNEWRISHAKTLIQGGKASEMTLEAIGLLSGFSSRNAFITDFKKVEGISPGVYASRFN